MLQRAVFVIDRDGTIAHAEYVADQMTEPNYEAALMVVDRLIAQAQRLWNAAILAPLFPKR